ncbi:MAG: formate dehydrogenase accessory protein FdhE [Actinomycetota bacterium]
MRTIRGGPGSFESRLARAQSLESTPASAHALTFLSSVLRHQCLRVGQDGTRATAGRVAADVAANRLVERFPLLDLGAARDGISSEIDATVAVLAHQDGAAPAPLREAARDLTTRPLADRRGLIEAWSDDPALLDPRLAFWIRVAAGPILESAAGRVDPLSSDQWGGRACPACGDVPQCSAIIEESGGFLQGAPRYLICGRCATWWAFPRAVCPSCGEDDSRKLGPYVSDEWDHARIDMCDTCRSYVKTFDLRKKETAAVIPLVDDVATLALDVWAHETGLTRPGVSLAGV